MGNIIPESIMEGKKISCAIMVSLAWFFTANPKTLPILRDTITQTAILRKNKGKLAAKPLETKWGKAAV